MIVREGWRIETLLYKAHPKTDESSAAHSQSDIAESSGCDIDFDIIAPVAPGLRRVRRLAIFLNQGESLDPVTTVPNLAKIVLH